MHQSDAATLGVFFNRAGACTRTSPSAALQAADSPSAVTASPTSRGAVASWICSLFSCFLSPPRATLAFHTRTRTHTHARPHISACSRRWCEFLNTLITVLDLVRACLQNCIFGLLMLENKPSLDSAGGFSLPLAGGAPVFAHGAVLLTVEHLCSCCRVKVAVCVHAH